MKEQLKCELCGRTFFGNEGRFPVGKPVIHHLVPKQKFRGKSSEAQTITICSRCHKQLHRLYDNYMLKMKYCTLSQIKKDPELKKFITWLRKDK